MKNFILIILFLAFSFIGFSQKIIIEDRNQEPLANATLFCIEKGTEFISNKNGIVVLPNDYDKILSFICFKESYQSATLQIDFTTQKTYLISLDYLSQEINQIDINAKSKNQIENLQLKGVENMSVYESKKTEKIEIKKLTANLSTNNNRQVFAKVPGINIWESSSSGVSTEVGGRGLSPQRSSNFNVRQNNYDISADALGYPDAYYVPSIEAVEKIEIVRGASSLQYGTQFGGIINYVLKEPNDTTPLHLLARQTAGSYGFSNTYLQINGTHKKLSYISIGQYKRGNAWRENSGFNAGFSYNKIAYQFNEKLNISAQYTFYNYLAQQAGGLTDKLFEQDPQQSIRDRNFCKVNWHLPQVELNYKFNSRLKIQSMTYMLFAQRYALGVLGNITRTDPLTERDLLIDHYKNLGNETRLLYKYNLFNQVSTFLVGARFYKGQTQKQQGFGSDGDDADFEYLNPDYLENSDYTFPSRNIAVFVENIFRINPKWSITPGFRLENISTNADGYYRETTTDLAGNVLVDTSFNETLSKNRTFLITGLGTSFKINAKQEIYANISQNYRAVNFNDIRILNQNAKVDPNLTDEKGFNTDIGYRGTFKDLIAFDISAFYLYYQNRIGSTLEYDSTLFNLYRFQTNVAASRNIGLESVFEIDFLRLSKKINKIFSFKYLLNFSYIDGRYIDSKESAYHNKKVELVPNTNIKTSLNFIWKDFSVATQLTYLSQQYTDATNTELSSDAVNGLIPAYYVMDLSAKYKIKGFILEGSINNITNNTYFTRRAAGYPGPGIIPADPITFYFTLGYEFGMKGK